MAFIEKVEWRMLNKINEIIGLVNQQVKEIQEMKKTLAENKLKIDLLADFSGTKSQILQDLFVLKYLRHKTGGYFVEFGALDGLTHSNTYLLEKKYGWSGILVEPARSCHELLRQNRNAIIDTRCVWSHSNLSLDFSEVYAVAHSTITAFKDSDFHSKIRSNSRNYSVETVSLLDLLKQHNAPSLIDYLSIDTEGSEFEILNSFDFSLYKFKAITCEHNFTDNRSKIFDLLVRFGYKRIYTDQTSCDDWYVLE
ncbi:MAG: FkbM family methyltransferase [Candidatus Riflebacteria bacterium]|nr:FkbM family methyltransferase [Candidatus Riflebacteria bacterium]